MLRLILTLLLTPQAELPFIDALPLDYPNRRAAIDHYVMLAQQMPAPGPGCTYPYYREATRFLLVDMLLQGHPADEVLYMLGRLWGRHPLWQTWLSPEGWASTGWLDEAFPAVAKSP